MYVPTPDELLCTFEPPLTEWENCIEPVVNIIETKLSENTEALERGDKVVVHIEPNHRYGEFFHSRTSDIADLFRDNDWIVQPVHLNGWENALEFQAGKSVQP